MTRTFINHGYTYTQERLGVWFEWFVAPSAITLNGRYVTDEFGNLVPAGYSHGY